jgi:hypothetical protein
MAELLRARCSAGWLIITDQAIRIERKGLLGAGGMQQMMPRQAIVGASLVNTYPAVFGKGGASTLTFTGMGAMIEAKMVNAAYAKRIMRMLGYA